MIKQSFIKLFKDFDLSANKIDIKLTDRPQKISVDKFLMLIKEYENQSN